MGHDFSVGLFLVVDGGEGDRASLSTGRGKRGGIVGINVTPMVDVVLVNKIDAMEFFDFKMDAFTERMKTLNPMAKIIPISAKTGEGFGALAGIVQDIARRTCDGKVLITLEGGYDPEGLRNGVRAVLQTLLGRPAPFPKNTPSADADEVIARIVSVHKKYWKSLK